MEYYASEPSAHASSGANVQRPCLDSKKKRVFGIGRAVPSRLRERQRERERVTQQLLALSLEDVATELGMMPKKGEKGKWCNEQLRNISITEGKGWYDWNACIGGKNPTGLVMHVLGIGRASARDWLANQFGLLNGINYISLSVPVQLPQRKVTQSPQERCPFIAPVANEQKWIEVRHYLVVQRCLSQGLVDTLHQERKIYATGASQRVLERLRQGGHNGEGLTNAVFVRHNFNQEIVGASLRGIQGEFKGLAEGSKKDEGWFSFIQGEGEAEKVVLVESAIDAMSAAVLAKHKDVATIFLATDGAGAIPILLLRQVIERGGQMVLAQDADRAGQEQAWKIVRALGTGNIIRAIPPSGKDWNEFLQATHHQIQLEQWSQVSEWWRIAKALGKSSRYVERVEAVVGLVENNQLLSQAAEISMRHDFHCWQEIGALFWKWRKAAIRSEKSLDYLHWIADTAIAFYSKQDPAPLSEEVLQEIQYTAVCR